MPRKGQRTTCGLVEQDCVTYGIPAMSEKEKLEIMVDTVKMVIGLIDLAGGKHILWDEVRGSLVHKLEIIGEKP